MKVVWLFPPAAEGGFPNVSQYRFYKKMPIRASIIYPYLAAMGITQLQRAGFEATLLDCPTMNLTWFDVWKELEDVDIVVLEGRTPTIFDVWHTCEIIRQGMKIRRRKVKIILYGDHVSWNPEESLGHADYIVRGGDYDAGVATLCNLLRVQGDAPKVWNISRVADLDLFPFCDRNAVDWRLYYEAWRHRDNFVWTMSQRGCFYKCTFCAWAGILWNNQLFARSPKNVADEYELIFNELGECEVLDDADLFHTKWGFKFARELISRGYNHGEILWAVQTHPNMIQNLFELKTLRKSGLRTVKLGVEFGNQVSLNKVDKRTTIKQIEKAVRLLKAADIMVHANLIVGPPWENKKMAYATIEWVKKLDPNQAQFSLLIPYPWTKLYEEALEKGWLLVKPGEWNRFDASQPMLKMEGMTPEEIVQLYKDCWSKFYFNPRYIWNHIKKVRHWEGILQLYRGFRSITRGHMKAVECSKS